MDIVFIEQLSVITTIGVYDWEQTIEQKLVFDIEMGWDNRKSAKSDDVNDCLSYADISEAVVLPLMKSGGGVLRIAAFCVTNLAPEAIKTSLSKVIPPYMVPSQIIIKDALPLNPNGKIDRKLLDSHARTH